MPTQIYCWQCGFSFSSQRELRDHEAQAHAAYQYYQQSSYNDRPNYPYATPSVESNTPYFMEEQNPFQPEFDMGDDMSYIIDQTAAMTTSDSAQYTTAYAAPPPRRRQYGSTPDYQSGYGAPVPSSPLEPLSASIRNQPVSPPECYDFEPASVDTQNPYMTAVPGQIQDAPLLPGGTLEEQFDPSFNSIESPARGYQFSNVTFKDMQEEQATRETQNQWQHERRRAIQDTKNRGLKVSGDQNARHLKEHKITERNREEKARESARKRRESQKRYRDKHPDKAREYRKMYKDKHPDKAREYRKTYRDKHPDKVRDSQKKYEEKHRDKVRETGDRFTEKMQKNLEEEERAFSSKMVAEKMKNRWDWGWERRIGKW